MSYFRKYFSRFNSDASFKITDKKLVSSFTDDPEFPFLVSFPRTGSHWLRLLMELYFEKPALVRAFYYKDAMDFTCYHHHDENLELSGRKNVIYLYRNPVDTVYSQLCYYNQKIDDEARIQEWSNLYGRLLKKWLVVSGEKPMTPEQAGEEFDKSEKGLRYQLIESKLMQNNEALQYKFEDLKEYTKGFVKTQMAQFGDNQIGEKELDDIVMRVLSNQEEVKRLSDQLKNEKLLNFFKESIKLKNKEVTYEDFIKEVYK